MVILTGSSTYTHLGRWTNDKEPILSIGKYVNWLYGRYRDGDILFAEKLYKYNKENLEEIAEEYEGTDYDEVYGNDDIA